MKNRTEPLTPVERSNSFSAGIGDALQGCKARHGAHDREAYEAGWKEGDALRATLLPGDGNTVDWCTVYRITEREAEARYFTREYWSAHRA